MNEILEDLCRQLETGKDEDTRCQVPSQYLCFHFCSIFSFRIVFPFVSVFLMRTNIFCCENSGRTLEDLCRQLETTKDEDTRR